MTEAEWLACEDAEPMLHQLEQRPVATARKLRLLAVAACRRVSDWFVDPSQAKAVDAVELFADGEISEKRLNKLVAKASEIDELHELLSEDRWDNPYTSDTAYHAAQAVSQAACNDPPGGDNPTYFHRVHDVIEHVGDAAGLAVNERAAAQGRIYLDPPSEWLDRESGMLAENRVLAGLFREVFGNPFRPVTFDPVWRTDTVVALARGMYESRDFSTMPILADALQDAGCDSEDVLTHCRDANQVHVRGCWVVDCVLGKK